LGKLKSGGSCISPTDVLLLLSILLLSALLLSALLLSVLLLLLSVPLPLLLALKQS
jgi:hypothetical protein